VRPIATYGLEPRRSASLELHDLRGTLHGLWPLGVPHEMEMHLASFLSG